MKFLAIEKEKPGLVASDFQPHQKSEALKILELYESGLLREIYFNQDHNAVIIMECESYKEAESNLQKLPLVVNGLIEFEIMELNPYTGFSRLI